MKTTLEIQNLRCGGCAHTISSKLKTLNGIKQLVINHENSTVSFHHENENVLLNAEKLLIQMGYPTRDYKNSLTTKVKSFVSCALGKVHK